MTATDDANLSRFAHAIHMVADSRVIIVYSAIADRRTRIAIELAEATAKYSNVSVVIGSPMENIAFSLVHYDRAVKVVLTALVALLVHTKGVLLVFPIIVCLLCIVWQMAMSGADAENMHRLGCISIIFERFIRARPSVTHIVVGCTTEEDIDRICAIGTNVFIIRFDDSIAQSPVSSDATKAATDGRIHMMESRFDMKKVVANVVACLDCNRR